MKSIPKTGKANKQIYTRLALILLIFLVLTLANSILLPFNKAPDEYRHFRYSNFIVEKGHLPRNYQERAEAGAKSDWPPLYHYLVGLVGSLVRPDGLTQLKVVSESPRADIAQALFGTGDLVNTEDELPPYRGLVLRWRLGRLISTLISLGTIVVAYLVALEVLPRRYRLAILSAAIIAFTPTFIFISSVMSDDAMAGLIGGLYFWVLLKIVKDDARSRYYFGLGLLMGLALVAKYSALILPFSGVIILSYLAWQRAWGWRNWLKRVTVVALSAGLTAGWWFLFIMVYFNEVSEFGPIIGLLKPFMAGGPDDTQNQLAFALTGGQIGKEAAPTSPPFWLWVQEMYRTFWVMNIDGYPLGVFAHLFVGVVCLIAALGVVKMWRLYPEKRILISVILIHVSFFLVFPLIRFLVIGRIAETAQGRHILFPAATVIPLLLVLGWQVWPPYKTQRWLSLGLVGGLLCWSIAQLIHLAVFYPPLLPIRTISNEMVAHIPNRLDQTFGNHLTLLGYQTEVRLEASTLELSFYWRSSTYPDEDYIQEISLLKDGKLWIIIENYPTNGLYPTRIWEEWELVRDDWILPLIDIPPGDYQLQLRLRDAHQPLSVNGSDRLILGQVTIPHVLPFKPDIPFSVAVAGREIINGIKLWPLSSDYQNLHQTEYKSRGIIPFVWQGQLAPGDDVRWVLISEDAEPYLAKQASVHFGYFWVAPDWQPGQYRLRAEIWRDSEVVASNETEPLVTISNRHFRSLDPPMMQHSLEANFANRVKLLGYDLPKRSVEPGETLPVTLYWQGLRTMVHNYTFFAKVLDDQRQVQSDLERFPQDGYKTTHWLENEVVVDQFELAISSDVPPCICWLNIGMYLGIHQTVVPLPLVVDGQHIDSTSVTFGPIKIGDPPAEVLVSDPEPQYLRNDNLGGVIGLKGYDFAVAPDLQTAQLTFYWESLASTTINYTIFAHIQDEHGQIIAQKDTPPAGGAYPTSVWEVTEVIKDDFTVPLPPDFSAGSYRLLVGMYDFATGQRLKIPDTTENAILLDDFDPAD